MTEVRKPDAEESAKHMPKVPGAKKTHVPNEEPRDPTLQGDAGTDTAGTGVITKQPDKAESDKQRAFVPETDRGQER